MGRAAMLVIFSIMLCSFLGAEEAADKTNFPAELARCKVSGKILYFGEPPAPHEIDLKIHLKAREFYKDRPFFDERHVIDKKGGIAHVLVFVSKGLEHYKFPAPTETVLLEQRGYIFIPHVFGIRAGQPLKIVNVDDDTHNIHCICAENGGFNIAQPGKDMKTEKVFEKAELPFRIQCDLHIWMQAWCGVFDHPFFCVSRSDGGFELPALSPGKYEVTAWHERLGTKPIEITIDKDESKTLQFSYGENAPAPREASAE
jgi:hypothetical protein